MPLTDFQKRKVHHLFNVEDANGNGVLQEDDYIIIAKKQLANSGIAEDSEDGHNFIKVYKDEFKRLAEAADTNKDGKITLDEYTKYFEKQIEKNDLKFFEDVVNSYMKAADTNHDGKLSLKEYSSLVGAVGVSAEQAKNNFEKMDTNKDGSLDVQEFIKALKGFLFSNDPTDSANNFLGHQAKSF